MIKSKEPILNSEAIHFLKKLHEHNNNMSYLIKQLQENSDRQEGAMNIIASQLFTINETLKEGVEDAVLKMLKYDKTGIIEQIKNELERSE